METVTKIKLIVAGIIILFLWKYIVKIWRWWAERKSRHIPAHIKKAVLERYFQMCAVCPEKDFLDFHHRIKFADGGNHTEDNVVPLCPKHHAMVTRYTK